VVESATGHKPVLCTGAGSRRGEVERAIIFLVMGDRPSFITRENSAPIRESRIDIEKKDKAPHEFAIKNAQQIIDSSK
jgi:hypothetical protein